MFNSLFGLGQKFPVFGGGADGGKGGGGGGSAPGADPGAAKGQKMTTSRPAPTPGKKTPGPAPMPSRDTSGPYVAVGADGSKSIVGGREGGGYGQDYNMDGRISFGETLRDMTDRGGPGASGGNFMGGGIFSSLANAATGRFGRDDNRDGRISMAERFRDMTDGGGPGTSGDRYVGGGTIGMIGNLLGGPSARPPQMSVGYGPGPTISDVTPAATTVPDYTPMIPGDPRIEAGGTVPSIVPGQTMPPVDPNAPQQAGVAPPYAPLPNYLLAANPVSVQPTSPFSSGIAEILRQRGLL